MAARIRIGWIAASALLLSAPWGYGQSGSRPDGARDGYTLTLPVDEVVLTFHAMDPQGLAVNDLKAGEIRVLDNGAPPRRIIAFDSLVDRPIRAAFLMDTSESMRLALQASKGSAGEFAQSIFRQGSDQGLVMDFGYGSEFMQPWTADRSSLAGGIRNVRLGAMNPLPGTAIFDAIFRACFYGFKDADPSGTGNFILLFSDGENNAGHTSLDEALRSCQRGNVAIYAFRIPSSDDKASTGPSVLQELADKTGGRVFPADDGAEAIRDDLKIIESEMRNQYRVVYSPANLRHDGAFREIELQLPDRVKRVEVRSGYYAPPQ